MLISQDKLQHWLDHFYGYGSWDSKFWFVGYEDSGGDLPEEVADKINWFYEKHGISNGQASQLCNIRDLYKNVAVHLEGPKAGVFDTRFDYRFGDKAIQHGVWKNLIAFMHGYENKKQPDLLSFQQTKFGIGEALISLYPLPSPHNHAWYYSWLDMPSMPFLKSRSLYEDHVYEQRIESILSRIKKHSPGVVLMYGMNNINTLKKSIQSAFPGVDFKSVKAEKLVTPQYHRAQIGKTTLVLTTQIPTLRHGRIETGFDWEKFARSLR
jgi:hypothetical protein